MAVLGGGGGVMSEVPLYSRFLMCAIPYERDTPLFRDEQADPVLGVSNE